MGWDIVSNVGLGVIASYIASKLYTAHLREKERLRFKVLTGEYLAYSFESDKANPLVRKKAPNGTATIKHIDGNLLRMTVYHSDRRWSGDVAMATTTLGSVTWNYDDGVAPESYGNKQLLVRESDAEFCVYIQELARPESFGREVLVKKR